MGGLRGSGSSGRDGGMEGERWAGLGRQDGRNRRTGVERWLRGY